MRRFLPWLALLLLTVMGCHLGEVAPSPGALTQGTPTPAKVSASPPALESRPVPQTARIQPQDFKYLGAFRLPEASGGSSWEYSGQGLTYVPTGDPDGTDDGFPGSLVGFGHDQDMLVAEISIPAPVRSRNLDDLPVATTLQPFADLSGGLFDPQAVDLPRADVAYLPPQAGESEAHLYFTFGAHFQEFGEASHGRHGLNLGRGTVDGLWVFDGYSPYITDDYLFAIPPEWAEALGGLALASGRAREGPWSGFGPALFAFAPWEDGQGGRMPPSGATLKHVTPLLLYGRQQAGAVDIETNESMAMEGYGDADHWWGGAWLTAGDKAAVIFVGTKATGKSWYGFANGVVWPYECAEQNPPTCPEVPEWPYDDRGYWAEGYQAEIIFYDPADLVAVARGEMETWEPQPYATLVLDEYLYDPQIHVEEYKRDLVGAVAFDRERGLLYIIERLADDAKSVVHVFRLTP